MKCKWYLISSFGSDDDREPLALQAEVDVDAQGEGDAGKSGRHQKSSSGKGFTGRLKNNNSFTMVSLCFQFFVLF